MVANPRLAPTRAATLKVEECFKTVDNMVACIHFSKRRIAAGEKAVFLRSLSSVGCVAAMLQQSLPSFLIYQLRLHRWSEEI